MIQGVDFHFFPLDNPGIVSIPVAFLLGYSDVSAFNRAFKRWTGTTPLQYRRKTTS